MYHPLFFLDQLSSLPADLENYVLKPLFSFAGQGVVIDDPQDITGVKRIRTTGSRKRKVKYADAIPHPTYPPNARSVFYFTRWEGPARPANNPARLSKGKMIGVRYNKDKEWVGGTYCLFEQ